MSVSICTKCGEEKPIEEFRLRKSHGCIRRQRMCRSCFTAKKRAEKLNHRYNISLEDYDSLKTQQKAVCAICKKHKKLLVDHDHNTGVVRGLLCHSCNVALGFLDENPTFINNMLDYIKP